MNSLDMQMQFNKLSSRLGIYDSVLFVSKKARKLCKAYNNRILESEAVSWAISNEKPMSVCKYEDEISISKYVEHACTKNIKSIVEDYLSEVDNEGIKKSVRASVKASNEAKENKFIYIDINTEGEHSRVRVLTRMILYVLQDM